MRTSLFVWCARSILLALLVLPLIAGSGGGFSAHAEEALGDLDLQLRLLDVLPGKGTGAQMTGMASLEVLLLAALPTKDIRLTVEKPDGSVWTVRSGPFDPGVPVWSPPDGGEPLESGVEGPSVGARQSIRTTLVVPLEGAAVHEIIVKVTGLGPEGELVTEAMLKAPLGVELELPVDDGTTASFQMKEAKP